METPKDLTLVPRDLSASAKAGTWHGTRSAFMETFGNPKSWGADYQRGGKGGDDPVGNFSLGVPWNPYVPEPIVAPPHDSEGRMLPTWEREGREPRFCTACREQEGDCHCAFLGKVPRWEDSTPEPLEFRDILMVPDSDE